MVKQCLSVTKIGESILMETTKFCCGRGNWEDRLVSCRGEHFEIGGPLEGKAFKAKGTNVQSMESFGEKQHDWNRVFFGRRGWK